MEVNYSFYFNNLLIFKCSAFKPTFELNNFQNKPMQLIWGTPPPSSLSLLAPLYCKIILLFSLLFLETVFRDECCFMSKAQP